MKYENLTLNQRKEYKKFCDEYLGETITYSDKKEPLYFNENMNMYQFKDIYQGIRRFKLERINDIS